MVDHIDGGIVKKKKKITNELHGAVIFGSLL